MTHRAAKASICVMCPPADVLPLMQDYIVVLRLRERGREIYPRAEQSHDEGSVDMVGKTDIVPQRQCARQPFPYPDILDGAV